MVEIIISEEFKSKWPAMQLGCIQCEVKTEELSQPLWARIDELSNNLRLKMKIEDISKTAAIASSRKGYKACGKDPARYRLSAESLMRRVIKGNDLYQINNVVDIVNLASVISGFSIGGYDVEKIEGKAALGVGHENEPYEGIGRGELNIEFLPVLRDENCAFGSPTSDSVRTSVTLETKQFLMVYFAFGAHDKLQQELDFAEKLLVEFAQAENIERKIIS